MAVTDKLGGSVHNPTMGSNSCLSPRPSLLSRLSGLLCFMQRTEPELERSAAEQLAKESCVVPPMDREVLPL